MVVKKQPAFDSKIYYIVIVLLFAFIILAVLLFFTFNSILFEKLDECSKIQWEHEASLAPENKFDIKWRKTDDDITILVNAKTKGWLSLGFSPNESITGADVVVGWVENGNVYLQDRFVIDETSSLVDDQQDYQLLDGKEEDSHTIICFRRKLNTCDKNNDLILLQGSLPVIWAIGKTDPKDTSVDAIQYNESERGIKRIDVFSIVGNEDASRNEVLKIRMNNLSVPSDKENLYWCQLFKLPKFTKKPYFTGLKPILNPASKGVIHHIGVFLCTDDLPEILKTEGPKGQVCLEDTSGLPWNQCLISFVIWTVNNDKLELYPSQVGYPFGSTEKPTYIMMNNHYYNPNKIAGIVDNSGMEIYYTTTPPHKEASTMLIGFITNEALLIPPMVDNFKIHAICDPLCMNATFPPDGIHVFGVRHHAHLTGKKVRIRIFRDGRELQPIGDEYFDYKYEHTIYLKEELTLYATDQLMIECEFNSMMKNYTTYGGPFTTDEMCEVYLYYYPPIAEMTACWSLTKVPDILSAFDLDTKVLGAITAIKNQSIKDYFRYYKWSPQEIEALRDAYSTKNQYSLCSSGHDSLILETHELVKPTGTPYQDNNTCKNGI